MSDRWAAPSSRSLVLQRLYGQNEFAIKLGLEAIRRVLGQLGEPQRATSHTLVAGTNGKGSTASLLATMLRAEGTRTGLFTSPHLCDFAERIRIDGVAVADGVWLPVAKDLLTRFGGPPFLDGASETGRWREGDTRLTYFELALAIAVSCFEGRVDHVVYEVGLGGRLDATNALDPAVGAVTEIGLDHTEWLGDTVEAIALEKSAIARSGRPFVVGTRTAQRTVVEDVVRRGAIPWVIDREFSLDASGTYRDEAGWVLRALPARTAGYQRQNAAVAIALLHQLVLQGVVSDDHARERIPAALGSWRWPGRLDWLPAEPILGRGGRGVGLLLDAAHNASGAAALAAYLADGGSNTHPPPERRALVTGSLRDKDVVGVMEVLRRQVPSDAIAVVPIFSNRSMAPDVYCARTGLSPTCIEPNLFAALERSAEHVGPGGLVVVTGSLYLLGQVFGMGPATWWRDLRPPDPRSEPMSGTVENHDGDIQAAKRELIKKGLDQGELTRDEIAEQLPIDHMSDVELDVLKFTFKSLGITVVES